MSIVYTNSLVLTYNLLTYATPFELTIFKCGDSKCTKCDFDKENLEKGSQKCKSCITGWEIKDKDWQCIPICGDGKVLGNEKCDDGNLGGCLPDCSASDSLSTCEGGDENSPTICLKALLSSSLSAS